MQAARALRDQSLANATTGSFAEGGTRQAGGRDGESGELKKVRVFARIRPRLPRELQARAAFGDLVGDASSGRVSVGNKLAENTNTFEFDGVLADSITQDDVYARLEVSGMISSVLAGFNATIFAYGQTGSGKTHTIEGAHTSSSSSSAAAGAARGLNGENHAAATGVSDVPTDSEHDGVTPRAIRDLFSRIGALKRSHGCTDDFTVECSYLEIYNEEVFDLLGSSSAGSRRLSEKPPSSSSSSSSTASKRSLKIRWTRQLGFHIPQLTRVACTTASDALGLFRAGADEKTMGSHRLNETSSRSHAIFSFYIRRTKGSAEIRVQQQGDGDGDSDSSSGKNAVFENKLSELGLETRSQLNLVDLAGSERIKLTGTTGRAKVESIQINKSLFVLRKVIKRLSEQSAAASAGSLTRVSDIVSLAHVPYRESKLTTLLKHALGGNSLTLMVACLSPLDAHSEENVSTLRYATMARAIMQRPQRNDNPALQFIRKLKAENQQLRQQLAHAQQLLRLEGIPHSLKVPRELEGGDQMLLESPSQSAASVSHGQMRKVEQRSTPMNQPGVGGARPSAHAAVAPKKNGGAATEGVSRESEIGTTTKAAAADDPRDAQIRSLKRNVVENVQMIRKMFSIEQELRKELDDIEAENDTLSVRNRQLEEGQERLRERISILESVVVASAAAAHEHKARGVEAALPVAKSTTPAKLRAVNGAAGPPSTKIASSVPAQQQQNQKKSAAPQAVQREDSIQDDAFDDLMTPTAANIAAHKAMRRSSSLNTDATTTSAATSPEYRHTSSVTMDFRELRVKPNNKSVHPRPAVRGGAVEERSESESAVTTVTGPKSSSTPLGRNQRQFPEQRQLSAPASSSATLGPVTAVRAGRTVAGLAQPSAAHFGVPTTKSSTGGYQRSKAADAVDDVEARKLTPSEALANLLNSRDHPANPVHGKSHGTTTTTTTTSSSNNSRQSAHLLLSRLAESSSDSDGDSEFDNASDPTDDGDGLLSVGDLQKLLMGNTSGLRQKLGQSKKSSHRKPKKAGVGNGKGPPRQFKKSTAGGPRKLNARKKGAVGKKAKSQQQQRPQRSAEWSK